MLIQVESCPSSFHQLYSITKLERNEIAHRSSAKRNAIPAITGTAEGSLCALKVRTGEKVWSYPVGRGAINASPVVDGTRVYITHGEESEER